MLNGDLIKAIEEMRASMESYVEENRAKNGLNLKTDKEVIDYVKEQNISSIRLWFTDLLGFPKIFSITPRELESAFKEGMGFDGSSVHGYSRIHESDMIALPSAKTAQLIPFRIGGSKAIRMFAKVTTPDGKDYPRDPRNILKRNLEELVHHGLTDMYVGPEAEYFYFKNGTSPEILDSAGYFDMVPRDVGDPIRELTIFALESMGIEVEYAHHEVAPSQHEIDLKYKNALRMADNLQTYKWLVKEIAGRLGMHATFMPKPLARENGSGMHVHISLFRKETNAFFDETEPPYLSRTGRQFTAGVLKHAPEICMVTNQWVNSYKRLVPGFEAPVYIAWAQQNRSALVRVPKYKPGKETATRIEARFPDAACNPYLAFSVLLRAGLKGIENDYELMPESTEDLYEQTPAERESKGVRLLPDTLYGAVQIAMRSELMREALGEEALEHLVQTKLGECMEHRLYVSPKELDDYMKL